MIGVTGTVQERTGNETVTPRTALMILEIQPLNSPRRVRHDRTAVVKMVGGRIDMMLVTGTTIVVGIHHVMDRIITILLSGTIAVTPRDKGSLSHSHRATVDRMIGTVTRTAAPTVGMTTEGIITTDHLDTIPATKRIGGQGQSTSLSLAFVWLMTAADADWGIK